MDFRPGTRRLDGLSSLNPEAGRTFFLEPGGWMDFRPGTRRLDGLSSWNPKAGWTFVLEPGGWLDLHPGSRRLVELLNPEAGWTLVLEPGGWTDFLPGTRRLDGLSSWNPEAGWTFVLEPGGWMDLRPGTRRMVELLFRNLMVVWTFKGTFSYIFSTRSRLRRLPLGRLTSGTRCVRFVNLEYRDASHSTFRRWVTREFYPRDSRSLLWTRRFNSWILGSNETVVLFQNPEMLLGPEGRFWSPEAALDPEDPEVVLNLEVARDPEVVWEPGGSSRPEGHFEPGGRLGTRRKSFGNPEVPLDSEVILNPKVSFGPIGRFNPEVSRDPEIVLNPEVSFGPGGRFEPRGCLGTRRFLLDPEVILNPKALRSFQDQETAWGPEGTVLRLPRQDYSRYLFGFRIMPLGSWPLSSSYAVFYFCRMSLSGLEGAGVGVMTQVPGFAPFHIWRSREPDGCVDLQRDLLVYLFDSKSPPSGRPSLIGRSLLWTRGFNSWILGSNGTVVLFQNPEMLLGPEGHLWSPEAALDPEVTFRTRRLSKDPKRLHARDPEVVWEPEGSSRPGGRSEPRGFFLTRRSFGNPEVPLDPEVVLNPKALRSFQDPETAWGPEGSDLITLRLSLDPEFEVTDMVRGCWCGCYDTSARLRCFARLEKQGFNCSMYFTVLLQ
ncbi:hypothetical protein F2Q70_00011690 [Brassica cretica]|uniref:Uncharacterized protein n=1 Tax=Brassica cretica TaxID=69181 RepID=A0A8S9M634_BRACR|nr:hypothetical protein F2Q70_00011690 [Brassica cretica]